MIGTAPNRCNCAFATIHLLQRLNVAKPVPRDLSVASSVASLRSTTKEINRRRNRGNRKGKQATPRVSEDLTKSLTAAEALGSLEPIPLTRSAASELALLLEGI